MISTVPSSPSSSSSIRLASGALTPEENGYIQELKQRHPFCRQMSITFLLASLHNDCVNRIKEIAKSTIIVTCPGLGRYFVDKDKTGLNLLIESQMFFNAALILSGARTIEIFLKPRDCSDELFKEYDIKMAILGHRERMKDVQNIYNDAHRFISQKKRSDPALRKINDILDLVKRMSACIDMLRVCSDMGNLGSMRNSNSLLEGGYINQETLENEMDFVKNVISNICETPIIKVMKDLAVISYVKEFFRILTVMKQLNRKFNPSDLTNISQVTHFSQKLIYSRNNPELRDPLSVFLGYLISQAQLTSNLNLDNSLKGRRAYQINPQALNYCHTCINLLPELFVSGEGPDNLFLPEDLEGIFFMRSTLKAESSFSLINFCEAREKVMLITPRIKELTDFIEERAPKLSESIELDLSGYTHPISEEKIKSIQTEVDEIFMPNFLRLLLLRLLLESVEKFLVNPTSRKQEFQLSSSSSVMLFDSENQTKEINWYADLEGWIKQLDVSFIYQQFKAKQAANLEVSSSTPDTNLTMVAESSYQPPPTEVKPHISEVIAPANTSTSSDRATPSSKAKQLVARKTTRSKSKVVSAASSSKKVSPSYPIKSGSSSNAVEEVLSISPSDLQTRKYRHLETLLQRNGFVRKSSKGSHEKWAHQSNLHGAKKVIVPRSSSTIPLGTLHSILKGASSIIQSAAQSS